MSPKRVKRPARVHTQPVRLTEGEVAQCKRLEALYHCSRSDVLRAGIAALEREHALLADPNSATRERVQVLRAMLDAAGGRGLELANEIDELERELDQDEIGDET